MRSPDLDLDAESLPRALEALGDVLASRNVRYEVVAVGGSALLLLGLINRATRDLDVLGLVEAGQIIRIDSLPAALQEAAVDVARVFGLGRDWLNPGPAALVDLGLPEGSRLASKHDGTPGSPFTSRVDATRSSSSCTQRSTKVRTASTPRIFVRWSRPETSCVGLRDG